MCRKCCRKIKVLSKQKDGVWTVVLLTYAHATHTSLSVLSCRRIPQMNTFQGAQSVRTQGNHFDNVNLILEMVF